MAYDYQTQELREQILQARSELGNTIEALAAKTDVKARAREAVDDMKFRASQAIRSRAAAARDRTRDMVRMGASNVETGVSNVRRSVGAETRRARDPLGALVGGSVGAAAGFGIYLLLRRRWHRHESTRGKAMRWGGPGMARGRGMRWAHGMGVMRGMGMTRGHGWGKLRWGSMRRRSRGLAGMWR
jgi:hypothetical protein